MSTWPQSNSLKICIKQILYVSLLLLSCEPCYHISIFYLTKADTVNVFNFD